MAQFGAFQTHSQGAELVPSVAGLAIASFIRLLAVRYLHLRSEHANKESTFVWGDISWRGVQGVQARSCWAERECLISARFYFGVGPLQEQISECVVLWRTSKWLRWNSLIVIESWTPPFLTWSLSASSAWSTQLFIKDGYRRVWGESRVFQGQITWQHQKIGWARRFSACSLQLSRLQTALGILLASRMSGREKTNELGGQNTKNLPMFHNE